MASFQFLQFLWWFFCLTRKTNCHKRKKVLCCWLDIFATCSNLPFYFKAVLVHPITRPLSPPTAENEKKSSRKKRKGKWREERLILVRSYEEMNMNGTKDFYGLSYLGNLLLTPCFFFLFCWHAVCVSIQVQKAIRCLVSFCCAIRSFEQKSTYIWGILKETQSHCKENYTSLKQRNTFMNIHVCFPTLFYSLCQWSLTQKNPLTVGWAVRSLSCHKHCPPTQWKGKKSFFCFPIYYTNTTRVFAIRKQIQKMCFSSLSPRSHTHTCNQPRDETLLTLFSREKRNLLLFSPC